MKKSNAPWLVGTLLFVVVIIVLSVLKVPGYKEITNLLSTLLFVFIVIMFAKRRIFKKDKDKGQDVSGSNQ